MSKTVRPLTNCTRYQHALKKAFRKGSTRTVRHMDLETEIPQFGGYKKVYEQWLKPEHSLY